MQARDFINDLGNESNEQVNTPLSADLLDQKKALPLRTIFSRPLFVGKIEKDYWLIFSLFEAYLSIISHVFALKTKEHWKNFQKFPKYVDLW